MLQLIKSGQIADIFKKKELKQDNKNKVFCIVLNLILCQKPSL